MPLYVPPISRRAFLGQSAAAISLALSRPTFAAESDANFVALLSDTHIAADPQTTARGVNMTDNLARTVATLLKWPQTPAAVLVNGDCAYLKGLPEDYASFARLVQPLSAAGLPLYLTMGNHDARGPLYEALASQRPKDPPVASKHVSVVRSPNADWILLDSLFQTDVVTGELGEAQLKWLSEVLDAGGDKPAIVVAHHNPQFEPHEGKTPWSGIKDSSALFELLEPRKRVKAFVYGHTHNWSIDRRGDLHLVNLPPVAYVFADGKPNGWVEARTRPDGLDLRLQCHDSQHAQHGEKVSLDWRS
jgi:3',5'-cyclic AMP phosphodiesterase CpdA